MMRNPSGILAFVAIFGTALIAGAQLGEKCDSDEDCFVISRDNMRCSEGTCRCKEGFEPNGNSGDCFQCQGHSDVQDRCSSYGSPAICDVSKKRCSCQEGYSVSLDDQDKCKLQVCTQPIAHVGVIMAMDGENADGRYVGAETTFKCKNVSETTTGPDKITCEATGKWSAPEPSCESICTKPPDAPNGKVTYTINQEIFEATYTCNDGFIIADVAPTKTKTVKCSMDTDRVWPDTKCDPICAAPTGIPNGKVTSTYADGDTYIAEYTCNPGFIIQPSGSQSESVTCSLETDRKWNPPTCIPTCPNLTDKDNMVVTSFPTGIPRLNDIATYSCSPEGYVVKGADDQITSFDLQCTLQFGRAVWLITSQNLPPTINGCVATCPDLPQEMKFGSVAGGLDAIEGSSVTYACKDGWEIRTVDGTGTSSITLTCKENDDQTGGDWSGDPPTCSRVRGNVVRTGGGNNGNGNGNRVNSDSDSITITDGSASVAGRPKASGNEATANDPEDDNEAASSSDDNTKQGQHNSDASGGDAVSSSSMSSTSGTGDDAQNQSSSSSEKDAESSKSSRVAADEMSPNRDSTSEETASEGKKKKQRKKRALRNKLQK